MQQLCPSFLYLSNTTTFSKIRTWLWTGKRKHISCPCMPHRDLDGLQTSLIASKVAVRGRMKYRLRPLERLHCRSAYVRSDRKGCRPFKGTLNNTTSRYTIVKSSLWRCAIPPSDTHSIVRVDNAIHRASVYIKASRTWSSAADEYLQVVVEDEVLCYYDNPKREW